MNGPRIGSLFTGTGALDLAVMDVFGGEVAWHSQYEPPNKDGKADTNQYAARILARHWPDVPNLGDITAIDWEQVEPVDILTGGFPCQDVSSAGRRAGLAPDSRSGLWAHFARAISVLRPQLVVIENVQGLLSAKAAGDLEPCPHCVGDGSAEPPLRALGAVLGDLARLGFDAEWARVAASEVGAPHPRQRVFILAWPAVQDADGAARGERRIAAPGQAESRGAWADAGGRGRAPVAHADRACARPELDREPATRQPAPLRDHAGRLGVQRGPAADAASLGWRADVLELRPGQPDVDWGDYGPAVRRWEPILGRPVPWPTDLRGRLTPVFSEWMQGYPDGWVTCTPGPDGMSPAALRNAMLRALGNGVVRQQAAAALRLLRDRTGIPMRQPADLEQAA
jgi:DNA (cytosine-5)-methyltransferase 1